MAYANVSLSADAQDVVDTIAKNLYYDLVEKVGEEVGEEAQGPIVGAEQFADEEDLDFLHRISDEVRARLVALLNGE